VWSSTIICEDYENEETSSLRLWAHMRCTIGGVGDGCDRESRCDKFVYDCLGELIRLTLPKL
jgi:hypothetical protein